MRKEMKMKNRVICGVAAFAVAMAAGVSCAQEAVPFRSVAVENHVTGKQPDDALRELALHLSLVSGKPFVPAKENPSLTVVLGEKAPGEGEPEAFTSYGKRVGDRLYLWGVAVMAAGFPPLAVLCNHVPFCGIIHGNEK